jgi:hypothetical protein
MYHPELQPNPLVSVDLLESNSSSGNMDASWRVRNSPKMIPNYVEMP